MINQLIINMKRTFYALIALALSLTACHKTTKIESSVPAKIVDGAVVLETPAREPGQESALAMACDPIDTVRIAFVGVGGRGTAAVQRYTYIDGVKIVAFCDLDSPKTAHCNEIITGRGLPKASEYVGEEAYKDLCARNDIDLVYIATDWLDHVPIALCAMNNGKHAAIEVPAAMTIKECWDLVNTCEKTRKHCTILENCCYDFFEMSALNMAQHGLFGEVYHVEGAYIHFL